MILLILVAIFVTYVVVTIFNGPRFIGYFMGIVLGCFFGFVISAVIGLFFNTVRTDLTRQELSPIVTTSNGDRFYLKQVGQREDEENYAYRLADGEVREVTDFGTPDLIVFEDTDEPYIIHYRETLRNNTWLQYVFLTFTPIEKDEVHLPQGSVYFAVGDSQ
jgi:hypothetical protein